MMSSNPQVWESDKSRLRMVHIDEPGIRTVQIAGSDPKEMADAARINVESGAQIIDINMGCPAKKVNRKLAGSALLQYPDVVKSILTEVVNAVDVPVTLKIRTGWAPEHRNCEEIAQLAEDCGIQALTIHGRTRACLFNGEAEYDSIRGVEFYSIIWRCISKDIHRQFRNRYYCLWLKSYAYSLILLSSTWNDICMPRNLKRSRRCQIPGNFRCIRNDRTNHLPCPPLLFTIYRSMGTLDFHRNYLDNRRRNSLYPFQHERLAWRPGHLSLTPSGGVKA